MSAKHSASPSSDDGRNEVPGDVTAYGLALVKAGIEGHLRSLRLVLAAVNAVTAVALLVDKAGASPAFRLMEQYAPLPVWAVAFAVVAVLLMAAMLGYSTNTAAHAVAVVLWLVPAFGAIYGLISGTTTSPTASIVLTALIVGMTAHHALALVFLRRMARMEKK